MTADNESVFLGHEPCPACGSSDALARYDDGHGHCFACGHYDHGDGEPRAGRKRTRMSNLLEGEFRELGKRNITEETCRKFGYMLGRMNGQAVQIAPYYDADRTLVAQKIRFPKKEFKFIGDTKAAGLFGAHLWGKGKKIVITEGEIDAMSVSQMQDHKWPVVSLQNGASGAKKSLKKCMDYLDGFEEVILMFDQDEPGQEAAADCAELFEPGRCKIAALPEKDPNACLTSGQGDQIIRAIWNARPWRPDGIIDGAALWDTILTEEAFHGVESPWAGLNEKTHGLRTGEVFTICAGTGVGKSAVVRELAYWLIQRGETVGLIMLEENTKRTGLGIMGLAIDKPLHISRDGVTEEEFADAFNRTLGTGRVFLYDSFGSSEIDNLLNRVRYMARSLDCRWVILDHISIVVSGLGDGDERRLIDNAMTRLRTLVEETDIGLFLVSHLKRPEGKGHEEGAQTSLSQLRGSAAIAQLSDMVVGLERDQQGENPNVTTVRVLKNRFNGQTGIGTYLRYNPDTGRLTEKAEDNCPFDTEDDEEKVSDF